MNLILEKKGMWFVDRRVDRRSAYECNVIIACRSFIRNKELALYTIYKNIVYVLANFFFSFFSAYSAQSIFPELLLSTYNLLWTLFPVIAVAILERDVCHYTAENNPEIYLATQIRGTYKFAVDVCQWALSASWHAIVAFFLPYFIMHQSE
jgi:phospholipid-transporting ATPase